MSNPLDDHTAEESIEVAALSERAFQEARRRAYLGHLWNVNRCICRSDGACIEMIAPRAGYTESKARDVLKEMGYVTTKRRARGGRREEEDEE